MDPTPSTTVHAGPAAWRNRRRAGVGRASWGAALGAALTASLVAAALFPAGALAAKPGEPPGQVKRESPPPAPVVTPAPTPKPAPTPSPTPAPVVTLAPVPATDPPPDSAATADPAAASGSEPPPASPAAGSTAGGGAGEPGTGAGTDAASAPSADPDAEARDPAEALSGGATTDDRPTGGGSGPAGGSALPIALGGGLIVGVIGGLVLLGLSRRRAEDPVPPPVDPEPAPDPEQLLADALAAHGSRRVSVGEAERLPSWVRRLDPEMPILPTLQNAPGEIDDPGERRTGRFIARPDAEPGETY